MMKHEVVPSYMRESCALEAMGLSILKAHPAVKRSERLLLGSERGGDYYIVSEAGTSYYLPADIQPTPITGLMEAFEPIMEPAPYVTILQWIEMTMAVVEVDTRITRDERARKAAGMADALTDWPGDAVREAFEQVQITKRFFPPLADVIPLINPRCLIRKRAYSALRAAHCALKKEVP